MVRILSFRWAASTKVISSARQTLPLCGPSVFSTSKNRDKLPLVPALVVATVILPTACYRERRGPFALHLQYITVQLRVNTYFGFFFFFFLEVIGRYSSSSSVSPAANDSPTGSVS